MAETIKQIAMDVKIRNAKLSDLPEVADMVRANIGIIERRGVRNGVSLVRDNLHVYLYITSAGGSAVALVKDTRLGLPY